MHFAKTMSVMIILLISIITNAEEPAKSADNNALHEMGPVDDVKEPVTLEARSFVREVLTVSYSIKYYLQYTPRHPLVRNSELRDNMARAIVTAAREHNIPPTLLTTITYLESTFDITAKGALGEIGLTQVHGTAAKGCELETIKGQLDCGARWLETQYQKCGTWKGALTAYATKGMCSTASGRVKSVINYRLRKWTNLDTEIRPLLEDDFGG